MTRAAGVTRGCMTREMGVARGTAVVARMHDKGGDGMYDEGGAGDGMYDEGGGGSSEGGDGMYNEGGEVMVAARAAGAMAAATVATDV
jgi:hypothetical protein